MGPELISRLPGQTGVEINPKHLENSVENDDMDIKPDISALEAEVSGAMEAAADHVGGTGQKFCEVEIKQEPVDEDDGSDHFSTVSYSGSNAEECLVMKYDLQTGLSDSVVVVTPEAPEGDFFELQYIEEHFRRHGEVGPSFQRGTERVRRKGASSRKVLSGSTPRVHVCSDCGQEFKYSHHLKNHVDAIHKRLTKHACHECAARFAWRNQLLRHIAAHHRVDVSYQNGESAQDVLEDREDIGTTPHLVPVDGEELRDVGISQKPADEDALFSMHRGEDETSATPRKRRKSVKKVCSSKCKKMRTHVCSECGQDFKYSHHLQSHVDAIHKRLMKHACKECAARFAWRNQLLRHIAAHHRVVEDIPYQNGESAQDTLEERDDIGATPHLVPVAEEELRDGMFSQEPYSMHREDETSAPPRKKRKTVRQISSENCKKSKTYVCSECGQDFKYSHHLHSHVDAIHKCLTKYACKECEAKFAWRNQLQRHVAAAHKAEEQDPEKEAAVEKKKMAQRSIVHVCGECGHEFNWLSHLREHVGAVHRGMKKYACVQCDAKFAWRNQLVRHMKSHTLPAGSDSQGKDGETGSNSALPDAQNGAAARKVRSRKRKRSDSFSFDYEQKTIPRVGIERFECKICFMKFTRYRLLKQHKELGQCQEMEVLGSEETQEPDFPPKDAVQTYKEDYECDFCHMKFKLLSSMVKHRKICEEIEQCR